MLGFRVYRIQFRVVGLGERGYMVGALGLRAEGLGFGVWHQVCRLSVYVGLRGLGFIGFVGFRV